MAGYPHGKFRYKVEIDGLDAGGFSEVTGFDASIDVMEYREGDMVQTPMKIPGLKKYGNITLRQGLADSMVLYEWIAEGVNGAVNRKTITITLLDEEEAPAASWQVINAWPVENFLHDSFANMLFHDGSVRSISLAEVRSATNGTPLKEELSFGRL